MEVSPFDRANLCRTICSAVSTALCLCLKETSQFLSEHLGFGRPNPAHSSSPTPPTSLERGGNGVGGVEITLYAFLQATKKRQCMSRRSEGGRESRN